jgi:hypothetical protein
MIAVVAIAIIIVASAVTVVYAQHQKKITTPQSNYSNITTRISNITGLNASIIINAINSKIRSIYDGKEEVPTISKIGS